MLQRLLILILGLILIWQLVITLFYLPPFILPTPFEVIKSLLLNRQIIFNETLITINETLLGLVLGIVIGVFFAVFMHLFKTFNFWFKPLLVISQAIPTFALAPLLV